MFDKFTNQYSLSKTLRFELKPVGEKTEQMLIDNKVVQLDDNRHRAYIQIKPYFDRLHRQFIDQSLQGKSLDFDQFYEVFKKFRLDKKDKTLKKNLDDVMKSLRKSLVGFFNSNGKEWSENNFAHLDLKNKNIDILFDEKVFDILREIYGEEKETLLIDETTGEVFSIFDQWKGFTGYFNKFNETRKNFYKDDGTSTALATRIIDQNLYRFADNIEVYETIKEKLNIQEVEKFFGIKANEIFSINFYNQCFLQEGINRYNDFLGGKTLENGEKIRGVNEIINKYRQDDKGEKLPFLKKLDKQILSEKEKFIDEIANEEEFTIFIKDFYINSNEKIRLLSNLLNNFVSQSGDYDLSGIFLTKEAYNTISYRWTDQTSSLDDQLYLVLKDKKFISNSAKKKEGGYSFPDFIALLDVKFALENLVDKNKFWKARYYEEKVLRDDQQPIWDQFLAILGYELKSLLEIDRSNNNQIIERSFNSSRERISSLLVDFKLDKESKLIIKDYADIVLKIYQLGKYFALEKKRSWNNEFDDCLDVFYTDPENGYLKFYENAYEQIVQSYNKIRNYLTKKPYSEDKWKLNFDNPTLAQGWDKNKETTYNTIILRKDGNYYLAVMKKGNNQLFTDKYEDQFKPKKDENYYEKLVYKFTKDVVTMIPKSTTQLKEVIEHFKNRDDDFILERGSAVGEFLRPLVITKKIFDMNNKIFLKTNLLKSVYRWEVANSDENNYIKLFQIDYLRLGGNLDIYKDSLETWIKFCFDFLKSYPSSAYFDYSHLKPFNEYENINDCYTDINSAGYKIWFEKISEKYIEDKNQNEELFLFQIYNKDFSKDSSGKQNLHTMYFNELFSQQNINLNFPLKLNGEAELFYRPLSLKKEEEKRNFKRLIVNKKRYTENKIFFHVPITFNRNAEGKRSFNSELNDYLANNSNINIIGIDRGEKHLAYYSVIDQKGKILETDSLNIINGVDYHQKLTQRAEEREQARKDWQDVEKIKDLKKGYISQVVRKLADLAIEYNAIIVMEDLNMRFKQIRGGIEKSIYQQLEKALIDKLNFLVNKGETDPNKAGHLLKAYQLTAPFSTFKDMGKQTGIIFYTQASYTSKIDPLTGWRPNLYLKYSSADKAKKDILLFDDIKFNGVKNRFEFVYDLKKLVKSKEYADKTIWTVCSSVERFRWNKNLNNNKGGYEHFTDLTVKFRELFDAYKINYNENILEQIKDIETKGNEKFFKDFVFYFGLICQIRNTEEDKAGNENDFILSPVEPFFDSRKKQNDLPQNGDENGAYNIARKGIIILKKVSEFYEENGSTEKMRWDNIYVSNVEWDNFIIR